MASMTVARRRPALAWLPRPTARRARRRRPEAKRTLLLRLVVAVAFVLLLTSGTLSSVVQWAGERFADHLPEAAQP
jgi:hypothetical protein